MANPACRNKTNSLKQERENYESSNGRTIKKAYVKDIDSSDETMRKIVGGNLEIMTPFKDMNIELIGNDFGKLKGLPLNRIIVDSNGNQCDYLCGTYIICGTSSDGRELVSLTEEQQEFYKNMFDSVDVCMWQ